MSNLITAPGLIDMHVHFREPGYEYKENILTGAAAAAAGGYTTCCCMPNTLPIADCTEIIEYITGKAKLAPINVLPIGAVTIGQQGKILTDFAALKKAGAVAVSDDGMPIVSDDIMRHALRLAKKCGLLLISHCEDEAEMAERDVRLAAEENARIHIAHVSLAETVEIIRRAKASGTQVTAETCPHYFSLTEEEVAKQGAMACMNPPLRTAKDVSAIIEGLCDGTIDAIATDHAPHSDEEKALPPGTAPNGIIGLETSLAVTLTFLYHTGILTLDKIIKLMSINPARILGTRQGDGSPVLNPPTRRQGDGSPVLNPPTTRQGDGSRLLKKCHTERSEGSSRQENRQTVTKPHLSRHCEGACDRSNPEKPCKYALTGLLRCARNDEGQSFVTVCRPPVFHAPPPDAVIFDPDEEWTVDPSAFCSKARNTPYAGMKLRGRVKRTICRGKTAYED